MIPFGLTREQFKQRFEHLLDLLSHNAINFLNGLQAETLSPTVQRVEFCVFVDTDNYGAPSVWMYRTDESLVISKRSLELPLDLETINDAGINELYFSDLDFNGCDIMAIALSAWFAECWWKAGGWYYKVPADLTVHEGLGSGGRIRRHEQTSGIGQTLFSTDTVADCGRQQPTVIEITVLR